MCVCSLRYPACNAHAPYCHVWPAQLYNIFPHYFINDTIFDNRIEYRICVLIFSTTFVLTISHYKNNSAKYHLCVRKCSYKMPVILSDFSETWIFSREFWKILKYKISWKSVRWKPRCSMRTEGRTDMTKLMVALCSFTNAPGNGRTHSCAQNTLHFGRLSPSTQPFEYSYDFCRPRSCKASWNLTDRFNFTEERFDSTHGDESMPAKKEKKKTHCFFLKDVRRLYYLYAPPSISTDVSFITDSKEVPCV